MERLTDELIYLPSSLTHTPSTHLHLSNPTQFKKKKKREKPIFIEGKKISPESDPPRFSDVEWPCPEPAPPSALVWPTLNLPPAPAARLPTAAEQSRFAATQVQQQALKAAQDFFVDGEDDSDGDGDGGSDDSDEDDFMDEEDGDKEHQFFSKVFSGDGELRGYYQKNFEVGEFSCLVCGGIGEKVGKRFKGCVALVQHSNGIVKTKSKRAHRALAQVVCEVLGWDIDKLPTVGRLSAKSGEDQGNAEVGMEDLNVLNRKLGLENVHTGDMILKEASDVGQEEELKISTVSGMLSIVGVNVMLTESSLKADDADMCMENLDTEDLSLAAGKTEGVVHCLSSFKVGDANLCMENHDHGDLSVADGKTEGVVNSLGRDLARKVVLEMK